MQIIPFEIQLVFEQPLAVFGRAIFQSAVVETVVHGFEWEAWVLQVLILPLRIQSSRKLLGLSI